MNMVQLAQVNTDGTKLMSVIAAYRGQHGLSRDIISGTSQNQNILKVKFVS